MPPVAGLREGVREGVRAVAVARACPLLSLRRCGCRLGQALPVDDVGRAETGEVGVLLAFAPGDVVTL